LLFGVLHNLFSKFAEAFSTTNLIDTLQSNVQESLASLTEFFHFFFSCGNPEGILEKGGEQERKEGRKKERDERRR
jgi:hypothetical protein